VDARLAHHRNKQVLRLLGQCGTSRNPPLHGTLQLIAKIAQPLRMAIDIEKPRLISQGIISDSPKRWNQKRAKLATC